MVLLTLLMSIGAVEARIGTWLRKLSDGQPLVQGQLAARHGHVLACKHFTTGHCIHYWGVVRGTGLAAMAGSMFICSPC